jgi:hypothetical protein
MIGSQDFFILAPMTKKKSEADRLVINNEEYFWRFRHGPVANQEAGLKGISISVWRKQDRTRELILDFPFSLFGKSRLPEIKALLALLPPAILDAIAVGWDPDSRGRPFRFNVNANIQGS